MSNTVQPCPTLSDPHGMIGSPTTPPDLREQPLMATSHADIPGRGPDPRYHDRIRRWRVEQGHETFPGQAPPDIEQAYLEAHPDENSDHEKK